MTLPIRLTREAKENISAISRYISQDSAVSAYQWRERIRKKLRALKDFPTRHELVFSASEGGRDVRHTFFGAYRILYPIDVDAVVVLTVRHGARRPLTAEEVREISRGAL